MTRKLELIKKCIDGCMTAAEKQELAEMDREDAARKAGWATDRKNSENNGSLAKTCLQMTMSTRRAINRQCRKR